MRRWTGAVLAGAMTAAGAQTPLAEPTVTVYAAGSLRAALTRIGADFEASPGGQKVAFVFGASGLLRDRLLGGERADVFASANMDHPLALAAAGRAQPVQACRHVLVVPLTRDRFEGVDWRQAGHDALCCHLAYHEFAASLLSDIARIGARADQLARFIRLLSRKTQAGVGIGSQAQRIAPSVQAVVEAPTVRAAFDEQPQVQTGTIGEAMPGVTGLDRLDRCVRGDEVMGHAGTPQQQRERFCGSCRSSCNVNSEPERSHGKCCDKKKALEH